MDQVWINVDQRGSTWINCLQPVPSACRFSMSLQPAAVRPDSWLMRHASDSWLMRHASGVRRQASDSWLMRQASGVRRQASGVRLMAHASGVMRQTSGVRLMAHASCVRRPTLQASCVRRPASTPLIQPIQPPPVVGHDDNKAAAFPHATPFRFAPIELYGMG